MNSSSWDNIDWADMAIKVALAVAIVVVTAIVAKIVKSLIAKAVQKTPAMQRAGADGASLGESIGSIATLLVWLFGLIAVLQLFDLNNVLAPIEGLLGKILSYLPNVIGAAFLFTVGALIAKVVREIVQTALSAVNLRGVVDRGNAFANKATGVGAGTTSLSTPVGASKSPAGPDSAQIAKTVATVLYALIMIVVTISALQILQIEVISRPAEQMLTQIFNAVPLVLAAGVVLALGVLIARFVGNILEQVLIGVGTDKALAELNIEPQGRSAASILARVAQVAIVLFFAVMAANILNFPQITYLLQQVLELGGRVVFGGAVIAVGFFVAKLVADLASGTAATVLRYATLVLFGAMGLKSMGIADSIIELAFGALVVGAAAAAALAFGLGGRDAAARQLEKAQLGKTQPAKTQPARKQSAAKRTTSE